jgi:hypothetical protein
MSATPSQQKMAGRRCFGLPKVHLVRQCYRHRVRRSVDVILELMAAVATALLLGLIARDGIGMPSDMVREDALIAASIIVAVVAGISSRKPKQKL